MYAIRAASRPLRRVMATPSPIARALATTASNSTPAAAAQNGSTDGAATPRATARKQLLTLSEIDRLLTHVSSEYRKPADGQCMHSADRVHHANYPPAQAPSVRNATTPAHMFR